MRREARFSALSLESMISKKTVGIIIKPPMRTMPNKRRRNQSSSFSGPIELGRDESIHVSSSRLHVGVLFVYPA